MVECQVHHRIHPLRSASQAVEICKVSAVHLCAHSLQLHYSGIAARQPAHLVPCLNQLLHQLRPDESRRSRYKYTHRYSSYCWSHSHGGRVKFDIRVCAL